MTDRIDLDAIEKQAREAEPSPKWWDGDLVNFRRDDVLALVRAVRAAMAMEPWRVVDVYRFGVEPSVAIKPTQDLAEALAPFRKEDPK